MKKYGSSLKENVGYSHDASYTGPFGRNFRVL
jgi:hypothetical protein